MIAYYRVSTDKQGRSGLGLEAQRDTVLTHVAGTGRTLAAEYVEVESGKRSDRPQLAKAIAHAKEIGATLVFAKLDRLARNARFLLGLVESGADVAFCDMPQLPAGPVGKFLLTQMAAVAELEAGLIGQRTKAALAAAKARGVRLGGHRGPAAAAAAGAAKTVRAVAEAKRVRDAITAARTGGAISLRQLAGALNDRGLRTGGGASWSPSQVSRVLARLDEIAA